MDTVNEEKSERREEERSRMLSAVRKVLLAGIGVVALAQDEVEDFVTKLVERGEIAEKDGKKLVHEVIDKRKERTGKVEDEFTKRVEVILNRLNVPSKADIEALSEKIAALSKKVDELKKSRG